MKDKVQVGRLAMRQEAGYWCAYYAVPHDMKEALLLGSIRMSAVVKNKQLKSDFMSMMQDMVSDIIEEQTGTRPQWGEPTAAPEHERSGNA